MIKIYLRKKLHFEFNFSNSIIQKLRNNINESFLVFRYNTFEYRIPFRLINVSFIDNHKRPNGKYTNLWTISIKNDTFKMYNSNFTLNIEQFKTQQNVI